MQFSVKSQQTYGNLWASNYVKIKMISPRKARTILKEKKEVIIILNYVISRHIWICNNKIARMAFA